MCGSGRRFFSGPRPRPAAGELLLPERLLGLGTGEKSEPGASHGWLPAGSDPSAVPGPAPAAGIAAATSVSRRSGRQVSLTMAADAAKSFHGGPSGPRGGSINF